jgi:hypothetical protein
VAPSPQGGYAVQSSQTKPPNGGITSWFPKMSGNLTAGEIADMLDLTADESKWDKLEEIQTWVIPLNANLKILAMPYNGSVSWGIHFTDKKGRYDIDGQGTSLVEALNNIWDKFLDVQKRFFTL